MSSNKSSPNTSEMRPLRMPREDRSQLSLKYSSKPEEKERKRKKKRKKMEKKEEEEGE